jgi:hypothetical protein
MVGLPNTIFLVKMDVDCLVRCNLLSMVEGD